MGSPFFIKKKLVIAYFVPYKEQPADILESTCALRIVRV